MRLMQSLKSLCTESVASSECSQELTKWHLSLHRTQVIMMSLCVTLCFVLFLFFDHFVVILLSEFLEYLEIIERYCCLD